VQQARESLGGLAKVQECFRHTRSPNHILAGTLATNGEQHYAHEARKTPKISLASPGPFAQPSTAQNGGYGPDRRILLRAVAQGS
jgi:hypothetical protein